MPGFVHHELDIRDRAGRPGARRRAATGGDRPHRRPAVPRPGGGDPVRRLRHERGRHAEPARGRPPLLPREPVRAHEHEQGLRRRAEHDPPRGAGDALGLRRRGVRGGHPRDIPIDQSKHSLFGASKVAADVMVQEYGRYFGMPTCCLRGGCLTGPNHAGVELHGFLSYLVKCNLEGREYRVFGYKGKQVRDNIHSLDVARFIHAFIQRRGRARSTTSAGARRTPAASSRRSAGRGLTGRTQVYTYVEENRIGDHICYYSDLRKMKAALPGLGRRGRACERHLRQIVAAWRAGSAREDPHRRRLRLRGLDARATWLESAAGHELDRDRQPLRPGSEMNRLALQAPGRRRAHGDLRSAERPRGPAGAWTRSSTPRPTRACSPGSTGGRPAASSSSTTCSGR